MATNNLKEFRTAPPWEGMDFFKETVPAQYEILAEFPKVQWGWELDEHQWILRDPLAGEVFLGETSHGRFVKSSNSITDLKTYINDLTEHVKCAQRALEMLTPTTTTTQEEN